MRASVLRGRSNARLRRAWQVASLVVALGAAGAALPTLASAANPLTFATSHGIGPSADALGAISCPTISLCVAGDGGGYVLVSTNPAASPPTWHQVKITTGADIFGLSCATTTFCVAVDQGGYAWVSTTPAVSAVASWTKSSTQITSYGFNGISCASAQICVAVDGDGAWITTDAATTWVRVSAVAAQNFAGVSCPTSNLCAIVGMHDAATITNLAAGHAATVAPAHDIDAGAHLDAVSCVSASQCVAVDDHAAPGRATVSTNPGAPDWSAAALSTGSGGVLRAIACPLSAFCVAGDDSGDANFTTDATAAAPVWTSQTDLLGGGALYAISCPQSGFCLAGGGSDFAALGTGATLAVAAAGSGAGTITDSDAYLDCGATCSAYYAGGTAVTLTATPAAGDTFTGWGGGGCSGSATTCTVTNGAAGTAQNVTANFMAPVVVVPPAPDTVLGISKIKPRKHSASFTFTATGNATGFQCATTHAARKRKHHKAKAAPTPAFAPCSSPAVYKHLKAGTYTFYVAAIGPGGTDATPATKVFKIR